MDQQVLEFLRQKNWAVFGASSNKKKFGHKIYKLLLRYGHEVYPINPKETEIDGAPCYASLADLPIVPDVVDFVVPPAVALAALPGCKALGIKRVWFQPGVNTPEVVALARSLDLEVIDYTCAMVESNQLAILKNKPAFTVVQANTVETKTQLDSLAASEVEYVWFQPEASSYELIDYAAELGLLFVHHVDLAEALQDLP